jgi:subtilisin
MFDKNNGVSRRSVLKTAGASVATMAAGGLAAASGDDVVRVNIGFSAESGRKAAIDAADEVVHDFNFDAVTIRAEKQAITGLDQRADIRYLEEDGQVQKLGQTLPWGIDRTDADVAHANGETGNGADIAIIDTGIDDDHPDLQANVGAGKAYVDCRGRNCNYAWSDDDDHGTHCSGIADGIDNSQGVKGVSTEATLHALKVLDNSGSGSWSDVAAAVEYTADQGWDVGSLSLGGSSGSQAVKDAGVYATNNGVLLVAAAGNDGECTDCVGYPAAYDEYMAVSATSCDDTLAYFSSTGPEVEIAAPGEDIYSSVIGSYDTFSGTSMACPHVSGAGAQLMANGNSNSQARQTLKDTAEDLGLPSSDQGAGLLDVAAALNLDSSDDGTGNGPNSC